jgi:peptidoglycan/LPS O-acetylase OafA/YrhL
VILIGCVFFFIFFYEDSTVRQSNPWVLSVLFLALSAVGLMLGTSGQVSPGLSPSVFGLTFCCLALITASDRLGLIANRWMSEVGVCSYSIYLVHFALIDVAATSPRLQ